MIVKSKTLHRVVNLPPVKRFLTENRWIAARYFDNVYKSPDPYGVSAESERAKFDRAFELLGDRRFRAGLEVGCGEGANAPRLAALCDRVLALDISRIAIRRAMERNAHPRVTYRVFDLVADRPVERYDYVFCSETLVYLNRTQLDGAVDKLIEATAPGGVLQLVHCRCVHDDVTGLAYKPFGARTIHGLFLRDPRLSCLADEQTPGYRITLLQRLP